jgi:isoleucyl-tRNA synthetase
MDEYELDKATRPLVNFIDDLSTWYIRRSRGRYKGNDENDKKDAILTTKHVLLELSKLIAPFMPFIAEDIYKKVGGEKESVHLEEWPTANTVDENILEEMKSVRSYVTWGLEARSRKGIKVRQPLSTLTIRGEKFRDQLNSLIMDEVNVKDVLFDKNLKEEVLLSLEITPELKKEGQARDLIRHIQSLRKEEKLTPTDLVSLEVGTDKEGEELIDKFKEYIQKTAQLKDIQLGEGEKEVKVDNISFRLKIIK